MARACAREGANVVISARSTSELEATKKSIQDEFDRPVLAVTCDVTDGKSVDQLFRKTEETFGEIFGLVCNAGIYGAIGPFESNNFEEWKKAIEVNLFGSALCAQRVIPQLKKARQGRIIFLAGGGQAPMPHFTAYSTSKGGILRFSESLAAELHPFGVYVNAIFPGAVNTKFLDDLIAAGPEKVGKDFYDKALKQRDSGGAPAQKAADLTVWLLSTDSVGLYGKALSAMWDRPENFQDLEQMSVADIYTMKRVVDSQGGTRS